MTQIEVLVLSGSMPSSVAITLDVLATANRLQEARGRSPAFVVRLAGSGARLAASLATEARLSTTDNARGTTKAADVVVVPGLGMTTEEEVTARLARRDAAWAKRRLVDAADGGAHVATACAWRDRAPAWLPRSPRKPGCRRPTAPDSRRRPPTWSWSRGSA